MKIGRMKKEDFYAMIKREGWVEDEKQFTPEEQVQALEFLRMLHKAVKHIAQRIEEDDLTKIGVPIDYVFEYMKEEQLR